MIEKYFTVTSNQVELRINRVRINRSRPVIALIRQCIWSVDGRIICTYYLIIARVELSGINNFFDYFDVCEDVL